MRVNLDWLRDFVDLDADTGRIAADLTTAGLEVEGVEASNAALDGVVVAEVLSVARHPNADRLSVCIVADGTGQHQVVCGAPNVAAGIKAPFARVGAKLPGGKAIGAAELRGVKSNGMLCSAKELDLVDDSAGLLLLDADAPVGTSIVDHLRLADASFEINVTPNRGDCFSVLGIARELAAKRGLALREPAPPAHAQRIDDRLPVELQAGASCPRFVGRVVRGLSSSARTPLWMRERLRRAGLRPIQPIVDVTNYVMLELGQPLHAYDLQKLDKGIRARFGNAGEQLTLLDGKTIELAPDVLVIADGRGAVGLAGIMGGQSTAVGEATTDVFLESAFFAPHAIAGRARRYGMHTDASLRFERGVDPSAQQRGIERATELLLAICGGQPGPLTVAERTAELPARADVVLRRQRLRSLLGMEVADAEVADLLTRLGMRLTAQHDGWRVTPPPFRFDVAIEEDLVEEVGRTVGYDRVPVTPAATTERLGTATEHSVPAERIADLLVARGYTEAITYSFIDAEFEAAVNPGSEPVALANPIASDLAVLRRSLWPGLIAAARLNLSHQRQRLKLFEIGPQFEAHGAGVAQTTVVAGLAVGGRTPEHWDGAAPEVDFFDVKGDIEAMLRATGRGPEFRFEAATHPALCPGRTARIALGERTVGWIGTLHPDLQPRLDKKRNGVLFALRLDAAFGARVPAFRHYSRFPSIRRDLAVVVDETVSAESLRRTVETAAGSWLQNLVIFDVYRGKGVDTRRKSIALGLILQDVSRTLTDEDADRTLRAVMLRLERELGATIRT
ncbi:MAG TPA: phenylalanine--tRNA ligase subunit beta [Gammaproteobacteria bacterium]|nr:phenylalanine--tRNA ligase subunit beta [Gammaproteobacteria bacterium]